ncbi:MULTISPECIES: chemotaxis protein CheW [unclassified Candidatus Frackibacter]|uniref:chemotaxis protein CheW n=1 Tax=unclassified Candidatus Frackibacter TaxID=2648818 RepID=UPI0007954245|nr:MULTISPECIES: chemotaxis protein CheW [unclassified Candidatus Frackibacter]KXS43580.1 MAG: purine-binding chemotaxis protein CheW [Candidatus Frackibacter sp. T328-2]SDC62726.1 purine-binding chemotaxis protein CheW [Candidatus Frackibacter sp. WG11]SEM76464.1 purine-binding chemotaxis protein CheW [Candidatus Frackibacter sp. WG12]SFL86107.1 purine-binding chemotaxis protein CheW [Candidatus Frackibacter sp. WG13]
MSNETKQLIVFDLGGEEFGVKITKVQEIIRMKELTQLPNASEFMAGIINLRGDIISVIDLRKRFGVEQKETKKTRIIIVEMDNQDVGLIVDSVSEVLRIEPADIEDAPERIAGIKDDYLKGIGKVDDRIIILLDLDQLLTTEEKIELENASQNVNDEDIA